MILKKKSDKRERKNKFRKRENTFGKQKRKKLKNQQK